MVLILPCIWYFCRYVLVLFSKFYLFSIYLKRGNPMKILVVDDDAALRLSVAKALMAHGTKL